MKRRQFITLIGATAAWPLGAGALQPEQMRRIGVLMHAAADNPIWSDGRPTTRKEWAAAAPAW
jgi:hypothetical protein